MNGIEEHYCVRWKGFHNNIVSALEDLKTDEEFVDVTLSCDGKTLQGHKVILSASSPYFRKILKDNPCRHPVLILNDIPVDILEAIMTYMYHGTVSVHHNKLQVFLKTAEALKIKGIVDCFDVKPKDSENNQNSDVLSEEGDTKPVLHPAGDLSLLASAATESAPVLETAASAATAAPSIFLPAAVAAAANLSQAAAEAAAPSVIPGAAQSNSKRRKTAPRKLGSFLSSPARGAFSSGDEEITGDTEKENQSLLSLALTAKELGGATNSKSLLESLNGLNGLKSAESMLVNGGLKAETPEVDDNDAAEVKMREEAAEKMREVGAAINLSRQQQQGSAFHDLYTQHSKSFKEEEMKSEGSLDLSLKGGLFPGGVPVSSAMVSQAFQLLPAHLLNGSSPSQLSLMNVEGGAAEKMAALLGPEQMAALLGPSWKSRQPRMCQYCNRMFSNKFNLKQHILNMHTVGREMQCEICNKKVKNKWYLRRHHVTHHGAPLKK